MVATPFRGVRVYTRSAMGMPGAETALEELMCHVLGHLLDEGVLAKIVDDLYCGGNSPQELLQNWTKSYKPSINVISIFPHRRLSSTLSPLHY